MVVKDQGNGFDPATVPDPLVPERLLAEHGRGIHLMKFAMDEVSFKRRGTEVHMRKGSSGQSTTEPLSDNRTVSGLAKSVPSAAATV